MTNSQMLGHIYTVTRKCDEVVTAIDDLQIWLKILEDKLREHKDTTNVMHVANTIHSLHKVIEIMGGLNSSEYGINEELLDIEKEYRNKCIQESNNKWKSACIKVINNIKF